MRGGTRRANNKRDYPLLDFIDSSTTIPATHPFDICLRNRAQKRGRQAGALEGASIRAPVPKLRLQNPPLDHVTQRHNARTNSR